MNGTFAQALEQREPDPVVVDPRDGAVLDLAVQPQEALVDVLLELRRREAQMKDWRIAVEDELVRRHGDREEPESVGDYQVDVDRAWRREWDPEELELVATDLVDRGLLSLFDISGLIGNVRKVDGRKALDLFNRADEETARELRGCFEWRHGRPKVGVTSSSTSVVKP